MSNYLSIKQLAKVGVKLVGGANVQVSKNAIFHKPQNITLMNNVRIDDGVVLSAHGTIEIGNYVHIARNCLFYSGTIIRLEDFTTVSSDCKFYGLTDNYNGTVLIGPTCPDNFRQVLKGDIVMSKYSAVGSSCVLLPNTILHQGAAVGALSLVRGELTEWTIFGGNPLKKLKIRHQKCKEFGESLIKS